MKNYESLFVCEEKINFDKDLFTLISEVSGLKKASDLECVNNFLHNVNIESYKTLTVQDIQELGFRKTAAKRLLSGIQLAIKLQEISLPEKATIRSPEDAAEIFKYLQYDNQERFVVAALNVKNQVIGKKEIFTGTLNSSIVHPREVMNFALKNNAASIIVAHQHPSGNPVPSPEDIDMTKRLAEAGRIIGIELLDHIIIGHHKFISLKEKGYM